MQLSVVLVALTLLPSTALAGGIEEGGRWYNFNVPDCSECSRVQAEQSRECHDMTAHYDVVHAEGFTSRGKLQAHLQIL